MQKDFRTAWLLLLLRCGASYGYELRRELELRALVLDPAVLYRSLRDMEREGLIRSHWVHSGAGPQRRVYELTDAGDAEFVRVAETIREGRDARNVFLAAYEQHAATAGTNHA